MNENNSNERLKKIEAERQILLETLREIQAAQASELTEPASPARSNMEKPKVLGLNNGHSILGNDNNHSQINTNNGFASKLILTLLIGFGMGAIAMATYIFMGLGKLTFSL